MSKYRIRPLRTRVANLVGIQIERETFPSWITRLFFPFLTPRKKWVWQRDEDFNTVTFMSYESAVCYIAGRLPSYLYDRDDTYEMKA